VRYKAKDLLGGDANDDDPGRIRQGANINGASFYSFLSYSSAWVAASQSERDTFRRNTPIDRGDAPEPAVNGYLSADKTYSAGGRALDRSSVSRGQGRVGEMTQLLSAAFDRAITEATKLKSANGKSRGGVILLVDEADALAQSREAAQMHHEDRAGVNAFIRGIDRVGNARLPAAVIMCTNRLGAVDPAVKRRAADILTFERPNEAQRKAVLGHPLGSLGLSGPQIETMVKLTGLVDGRKYGFTFSDLMQRLLPAIVLDAYPGKSVTGTRALEIAERMAPTPPFQDKAG